MPQMTLSELLSYNTEFLSGLSEFANERGANWFDNYSSANARAQGMAWQGLGGEAMQVRMISDTGRAIDASGTAMSIGEYAFMAAGDLTATHSMALYAVEDAEPMGLEVDENFKVTAPGPDPTGARREQAQAQEKIIKAAVEALETHRQTVAETLRGHHATLAASSFADGVPLHDGQPINPSEFTQAVTPVTSAVNNGAGVAASMMGHGYKLDTPTPTPEPSPPPTMVYPPNPPATASTPWAPGRDPGPPMPPTPVVTGHTPDGSPIMRVPPRPNQGVLVQAQTPPEPPAVPVPPKDCTPGDYLDDIAKVGAGGVGVITGGAAAFAGIAGAPETFGGSLAATAGGATTALTGAAGVSDGITDMEKCK